MLQTGSKEFKVLFTGYKIMETRGLTAVRAMAHLGVVSDYKDGDLLY